MPSPAAYLPKLPRARQGAVGNCATMVILSLMDAPSVPEAGTTSRHNKPAPSFEWSKDSLVSIKAAVSGKARPYGAEVVEELLLIAQQQLESEDGWVPIRAIEAIGASLRLPLTDVYDVALRAEEKHAAGAKPRDVGEATQRASRAQDKDKKERGRRSPGRSPRQSPRGLPPLDVKGAAAPEPSPRAASPRNGAKGTTRKSSAGGSPGKGGASLRHQLPGWWQPGPEVVVAARVDKRGLSAYCCA